MRPLAALALAVGFLAGSLPAEASCRQLSLDEKVRLADVIAYGTVTSDAGFLTNTMTFRVERVLKGSLPAVVQVRVGPEGLGVATSVDYRAEKGDHVLFLTHADGAYRTNDCSGSHPGAPTPEETAFLGAGAQPPAATLGDEIAALGVLPFAIAAAAGALALVVVLLMRRRYTSMREGRLSV